MDKKKKTKNKKMPFYDGKVIIYGILHLSTHKLVKVDLNEDNIWFEYDMSMYSSDEYAVVKLHVSFGGQ